MRKIFSSSALRDTILRTISKGNRQRLRLIKHFLRDFLQTFPKHKRLLSNEYQIPIAEIRLKLLELGVHEGSVLLIHSSIGRFFHGSPVRRRAEYQTVMDYAVAVVKMLIDLVGKSGTLAFTTDSIKQGLNHWSLEGKVFNFKRMPSRRGWLSEAFRRRGDVIRSVHPEYNVTAWGAKAEELIKDHQQSAPYTMDMHSPWYKLAQMKGKILLFGVTHDENSSIRLPEYLYPDEYPLSVYYHRPYPVKYIDRDGSQKSMNLMVHCDSHQPGSIEEFMRPIEQEYNLCQRTRLYDVPLTLVDAEKLLNALTEEMKKGNCWQMPKAQIEKLS